MNPAPAPFASVDIVFSPPDNARLASLCGQFDEHLKQVERHFNVRVKVRDNAMQVSGAEEKASQAAAALEALYEQTAEQPLTPQLVDLQLRDVSGRVDNETAVIHTRRGIVRGRTMTQRRYLQNIRSYDINFGVGPAGTGKTYLAVACAAEALQRDQVRRLVLTRPAVEAGERLGFLPGDLAQKIDPYLRPLYDALYEILGFDHVAKLMERNVIEVAPLAYMRGRTLNDSFIILDEAQNSTVEQMKMFLTRIGFGSTVVVTGDVTQVDLPRGTASGLLHAVDVLKNTDGISFTFFESHDVVRHPLIQRIVTAYEQHESNDARRK